MENSLNPEDWDMDDDELYRRSDINMAKNTLELNVYQVAYLNKLLQNTKFRFHTEEVVRK